MMTSGVGAEPGDRLSELTGGHAASRGSSTLIVAGLTLYPGWLSIRYLDEFRQVSFLAHIVYGAVLGLVVPRALRRWSA